MVNINSQEMKEFYQKLDVIELKYSLKQDEEEYVKKYADIDKIESAFQFAELTKIEYGDVLSNLNLIYARQEKSNDIVELFDLVRNKIIHQYINIDGLERLFSEKYIDFEWDMHLGMDYKSHKMKYYRDHFVHQIRNAYCMHKMLEEFKWIEYVEKVLRNPESSKISRYVCKNIEQQKIIGYYNGIDKVREYNEEHFYCKNIIYMACYMAALFHDIGYPEVTNSLNQKRIVEYISNLYNTESSGYNYSRLNALLQNSLLFRLVPFHEIQKRIAKDKADHGALSAIIFLLNFYENGAIHGLEPYKKCAVELAALAIYNHTNKYRYKSELKEGEYVKNIFALNPISYLLRICDDMQEWGRIYFELSNKSNLIICNNCKTPIIRKLDKDGSYFYRCNCRSEECSMLAKERALFFPMFDYDTNFPYRRIYNVTVCESLRVDQKDNVMCFHIDYQLDRLLHMAYINSSYAKYRIDELNSLKKMLDYQPDLPVMKVEYFMTANPILIKVRILEKFLQNKLENPIKELFILIKEVENLTEYEKVMKKKEWDVLFETEKELLKEEIKQVINEVYPTEENYELVRDMVGQSVDLYLQLLIFMELNKQYKEKPELEVNSLKEEEHEKVLNTIDKGKNLDLYALVKDCFAQFEKMYTDVRKLDSNPEDYYKQFETEDYVYGCIDRFLAPEQYVPVCERKTLDKIDGYTDLALFQELMAKTVKRDT